MPADLRRFLRLIIATLAAFSIGLCAAAERVPLEGTNIAVVPDASWWPVPMSSDEPSLDFYLCAEPRSPNSCHVRAEFTLDRLDGARAPTSLDELFARSKGPTQSRRTKIAGFDAIEISGESKTIYDTINKDGGLSGSNSNELFVSLTLQVGDRYYRCSMRRVLASEDAAVLNSQLHSFCDSLQVASH